VHLIFNIEEIVDVSGDVCQGELPVLFYLWCAILEDNC